MPSALLYCNSIIACAKAIQDVQLEDMGCSVGEYNINALSAGTRGQDVYSQE